MLAAMTWTQWLLSVVLIFVCLFLMLVILLQRGRGGGIASAFGGGGGSGAFGAKTGDVFTWITVVVAGIFVVLAVAANYAFDQSEAPVVATSPVAEPAPGAAPSELIPFKVGEDGTATIEQLPAGLKVEGDKPVTITPIAPPPGAPGAAPATTPSGAAQPATTAPSNPPPAGEQPPQKPKEEPATP